MANPRRRLATHLNPTALHALPGTQHHLVVVDARASGLAPTLQVGIRQTQPDLHGHAWVECNGHIFGETRDGATSYSLLNWKAPD